VTIYVIYRRRQGLPLSSTHEIARDAPIVEHEVEYESVLVVFEDGKYSREAVATAAKLAAKRRRGIHVLVTITVPASAPIDAEMPEAEQRAQAAIDQAKVLVGRRLTGHPEKVRQGEAGRRIVEEAREIQARALVMSATAKRSGASLFGNTIETVLEERPCRVIIEATPPPAKTPARA
jgi:APA family basic amino acid/polyamine antiporter